MTTGHEEPPDDWITALRAAYGPGGDPAARAALLARLVAAATPAEQAQGRARWRAWVAGGPAEQRFSALLPALLTGVLDPAGADYAWLQRRLARDPVARAAAAELRQILDAERAARQAVEEPDPAPAFPPYDLPFLAPPLVAEGAAAWPVPEVAPAPSEDPPGTFLLIFHPRPAADRAPRGLQVAEEPPAYAAHPARPPRRRWTTLLTRTLDPGGPSAPAGRVTIRVQARPRDSATCRLRIRLRGTGGAAGRLLVAEPGGAPRELALDAHGQADLTVPVADLSRLVITVQLL
jgi:hypothetical protein